MNFRRSSEVRLSFQGMDAFSNCKKTGPLPRELQQTNTPAPVPTWIAQPSAWCEIRPDPPSDPTLDFLDAGERAAIVLAELVTADRLLIDEWDGRAEAKRRHLPVTGTLCVLADAHVANLLDFEKALFLLRQTNFYVAEEVIDRVRQQIART